MVIELLFAPVNPLDDAVSVYVPLAVNTRLLNVATPLTAFAVNVPLTPDGVELMVTCAEEVVTRFPFASSILTVTALNSVSGVPVAGGSVENATWVAGTGIPVPLRGTAS